MKRKSLLIFASLISLVCNAQRYGGYGRGYDVDSDSPFTFESALIAFLCGLLAIVIGTVLDYLYHNKYEDGKYLKIASQCFLVLGILSLFPFIEKVWLFILIAISGILIIGYFIYYYYLRAHDGDREMFSPGYYLAVVWGFICKIYSKIKGGK